MTSSRSNAQKKLSNTFLAQHTISFGFFFYGFFVELTHHTHNLCEQSEFQLLCVFNVLERKKPHRHWVIFVIAICSKRMNTRAKICYLLFVCYLFVLSLILYAAKTNTSLCTLRRRIPCGNCLCVKLTWINKSAITIRKAKGRNRFGWQFHDTMT